ncbi:hypothetical protein CFC21_034579 [Triticum aestivum]|uniref:Uncharacterized protein n=3 Tax=Triticum TaxID=4564 RepID=A0A9R0RDQ7_TRITD|nr:hypothetical protein CFC21_034579 [Triticum aestivum]VAH58543.1 unnamed protein product [Triticum turgidum subsp. durum]
MGLARSREYRGGLALGLLGWLDRNEEVEGAQSTRSRTCRWVFLIAQSRSRGCSSAAAAWRMTGSREDRGSAMQRTQGRQWLVEGLGEEQQWWCRARSRQAVLAS